MNLNEMLIKTHSADLLFVLLIYFRPWGASRDVAKQRVDQDVLSTKFWEMASQLGKEVYISIVNTYQLPKHFL